MAPPEALYRQPCDGRQAQGTLRERFSDLIVAARGTGTRGSTGRGSTGTGPGIGTGGRNLQYSTRERAAAAAAARPVDVL